eukprot:274865-Chlamydomonas_euryale.AAC.1
MRNSATETAQQRLCKCITAQQPQSCTCDLPSPLATCSFIPGTGTAPPLWMIYHLWAVDHEPPRPPGLLATHLERRVAQVVGRAVKDRLPQRHAVHHRRHLCVAASRDCVRTG